MKTKKYNIKAKPTTYNGINFRSMLEARWACFFDLVGWKYQYEPFELNGRVPDFIIYCSSNNYKGINIIVEVKPKPLITLDLIGSLFDAYIEFPYHILILDENPFYTENMCDEVSIGLALQKYNDFEHLYDREFYHLQMKSVDEIVSTHLMYDGMINGNIERKSFIYNNDAYHREIKKLWKKAQNTIQFKSY